MYFDDALARNQEHFVALDGNTVVGIRAFSLSKVGWQVHYITIHTKYRNQGLVRKITEIFLNYVKQRAPDLPVLNSRYSSEGRILVSMWMDLANEYPELNIYHSVRGMGQQSTKFPLLDVGEKVFVDLDSKILNCEVIDCGISINGSPIVDVKNSENEILRVNRNQISKL